MTQISFATLFAAVLLTSGCGVSGGPSFVGGDVAPHLNFENGQAASVVIGQPDFVSNTGHATQNGLGYAYAADVDSLGVLRIADYSNSRIMGYLSIPTVSNVNADFVLGQTNFTSNGPGFAANQFANVASSSNYNGKYFFADYSNNRVQVFNSAPVLGNPNADYSIGSTSPALTGAGTCTASTLFEPTQAIAVNGKLIVADYGHHRVLIYNTIPTTNNASASIALGQPDLNTCTFSTTRTGLKYPTSIWSDGTKLVVADLHNNRVLVWETLPTTTAQPADIVLGQPDFTSAGVNNGGLSASSMNLPIAVVSDSYGKLFVSEQGNSRVLIWNNFPTSNQSAADNVLGQVDMVSGGAPLNPPTAASLSTPGLLTFYGPYLIVGDTANNRALIYRSTAAN